MTTLREAAQQALEALEDHATQYPHMQKGYTVDAITALRAALAQQEQEPVAWQVHPFDYGIGHKGVYAMTQRLDQVKAWERKGWTVQPLYTHPPRREWQGLTEEEIWACNQAQTDEEFCHICVDHQNVPDFARAIEAKLKEKNT